MRNQERKPCPVLFRLIVLDGAKGWWKGKGLSWVAREISPHPKVLGGSVNRYFTVSGTERMEKGGECQQEGLGETNGNVLELGLVGRGKRNQPGVLGAPRQVACLHGV